MYISSIRILCTLTPHAQEQDFLQPPALASPVYHVSDPEFAACLLPLILARLCVCAHTHTHTHRRARTGCLPRNVGAQFLMQCARCEEQLARRRRRGSGRGEVAGAEEGGGGVEEARRRRAVGGGSVVVVAQWCLLFHDATDGTASAGVTMGADGTASKRASDACGGRGQRVMASTLGARRAKG